MKLELLDGGVIYVNPARVVAVETIENEEGKPIGAAVVLSATTPDESGFPSPVTAEVKGTADDVATALGIG